MTSLNRAEALRVAGLVAPALRSGRMSRKVKVVRSDTGEVVREIDGDELGKRMLARVGIELDVLPDPKRCKCGHVKHLGSAKCPACQVVEFAATRAAWRTRVSEFAKRRGMPREWLRLALEAS